MRKLAILTIGVLLVFQGVATARDAADRADRVDTNASRNKIRQQRLDVDRQLQVAPQQTGTPKPAAPRRTDPIQR
jgi:hypothetical protein